MRNVVAGVTEDDIEFHPLVSSLLALLHAAADVVITGKGAAKAAKEELAVFLTRPPAPGLLSPMLCFPLVVSCLLGSEGCKGHSKDRGEGAGRTWDE